MAQPRQGEGGIWKDGLVYLKMIPLQEEKLCDTEVIHKEEGKPSMILSLHRQGKAADEGEFIVTR